MSSNRATSEEEAKIGSILSLVRIKHSDVGNFELAVKDPESFNYSAKLDNGTRAIVTQETVQDYTAPGKLDDTTIENIYNSIV